MSELGQLAQARLRSIQHAGRAFLKGSRLRMAVITALVGFFWLLMFGLFQEGFQFIHDNFLQFSDILLDYLFAFFFISLLVMMTISNTIIAYTSLFRSEETEFLLSLPLHAEKTFIYRSTDSVVFGLWGLGSLVMPMVLAYGLTFPVPWHFYLYAAAFSVLFLGMATVLGALLGLAVAVLVQRHRKLLLWTLGVTVAVALLLWVQPLWEQRRHLFTQGTLKDVFDRIAFCQHWALPSRWVSHGMLSAAHGDTRTATFKLLLLLANTMFAYMVAYRLAMRVFRTTWEIAQGGRGNKQYRPAAWKGWLAGRLLFFLPPAVRRLVRKDLTSFLRDPSQWSQFALFFGLLGLYILNLPSLDLEGTQAHWSSLISMLNLGATCLTLATLTSRFVFPLLSLEGRRIWVIGLLPVRRSAVLWGKWLFATAGTFIFSGILISLSDLIIGLPFWVLAAHLVIVFCVCCGLNGLAVGLGAVYPRLGTDSPARIVSSFGGTLNLVCSIVFIVLALVPVALPIHLYLIRLWPLPWLAATLIAGLLVVAAASALVCLVPMALGARAFSRMEF